MKYILILLALIIPFTANAQQQRLTDATNMNVTAGGVTSNIVSTFRENNYLPSSPEYVKSRKILTLFDEGANTAWIKTSGNDPSDDTNNILNNSKSLLITATNGSASASDLTTSIDITGYTHLTIKALVDDPSKLSSFTILLSSDAGYENYYSWGISGSNVTSNVTKVFNPQLNTFQYAVEYVMKFTDMNITGSPNLASIVRIRVRVTPTTSNTVSVAFAQLEASKNPNTKGRIIFSFDDGLLSTYEKAAPILSKYNMAGALSLPPARVGTSGYMTLSNVKSLQDSFGWDVLFHSYNHVDLTTITNQAVKEEIVSWKNYAKDNGISFLPVCIYPYGGVNMSVVNTIDDYFIMGRGTAGYNWPVFSLDQDKYRQKVRYFNGPPSATSLATAQSWVDNAVANDAVSIFVLHNLTATPVAATDWSVSDFTSLVAYVKTQVDAGDLDVITYSDELKDNYILGR